MAFLTEADLEAFAMEELAALGITTCHGATLGPDAPGKPRPSWRDAILRPRLEASLKRLNPDLPPGALRDAAAKVMDAEFSADPIAENRRLHDLLVRGVQVSHAVEGEEAGAVARVVDWEDEDNDWLAANQLEIVGRSTRIPDIVLYLNGLPLVVVELKGTEGKGLPEAFNQIQTYKADLPELFRTNLLSVISDGITARYGSVSADFDRFMRWRTVDGETLVPEDSALALETLIKGLMAPKVLLEMLRRFAVFEDEGKGPIKKIAGYHQFHAVRKGVASVLTARAGDGRGGVIWHTQGSGKSLLMAFLGGALMHEPTLENPTLVVLTDRNDLDEQLFGTFARCTALFGETPQQAGSVAEVKELLTRKVGGVIFTTIQKFRPEKGEDDFPKLTDRSNVVVFVDEAHRSQYGFEAKMDLKTGEIRYGFAHHMRRALPNATFVGFTGTPVELVNANTYSVFGHQIDVYDIAQAVQDGATVPIYYEARVAKVEIAEEMDGLIDEAFEDLTEGVDEDVREATAKRWGKVEALVGADKRLDAVVTDIVEHFENRQEAMDGKAMIVCMSRRIAVAVYDRIIAARPDWHDPADDAGAVKVVMTGAAMDPPEFQPHIRSKIRQEGLRKRYRKPEDPLKLVIVCDMWLTGFDAPVMHTLYIDKPMKGHGLMQAIARVNRVFRDKPAGLVVDYIGLAADLKAALAHYSASDRSSTGVDTRQAAIALMTALDVLRAMFAGIDYQAALAGAPADRLRVLPTALERALTLEASSGGDEGDAAIAEARTASRKRFLDATAALAKAFKLAAGTPEAADVKQEVSFFLAIQAALQKLDGSSSAARSTAAADFAVGQLVNQAVASTEVVDILGACGMDRPDISVLSDEFLAEIQGVEQKNLAVEALRKLLNGEIAARTRTNVVKHQQFSERLSDAIARYHNRSVDALQVIQELIALAKSLRDQPNDGLTPEEAAFYDALSKNESAVELLGNEELLVIAAELVKTVREKSSVDWWRRENVRSAMRIAVKRILKKHGFPPDLQADAIKLVIQQAEAMAGEIKRTA
jgi:type I restriction enzyme R subunit